MVSFKYPICYNDYNGKRLGGKVKTVEVLKRVLAGKRMSESSRQSYEAVFRSWNKM